MKIRISQPWGIRLPTKTDVTFSAIVSLVEFQCYCYWTSRGNSKGDALQSLIHTGNKMSHVDKLPPV